MIGVQESFNELTQALDEVNTHSSKLCAHFTSNDENNTENP